MKSKVLMMVAGGAMGLGSIAFAQNSNLDRDRAYQAELAADAGIKTQQLASNAGGFKLTSGNSSLNLGGYTIFRYAMDFRSKGADTDPLRVGKHDNFTHGFSVPYTKLAFWGNIEDPNLTYYVRGTFDGLDGGGGGFFLEQAYGKYTWDGGFYVKWGQFQLPFLREDYVDQSMQLLVDRSFTLYQFNPSFVQGVELGMQDERWRFNVNFTDGIRSANTDYNSPAEADWALTGRVEFQAMGNDWDRWNDFTSWKGSDNGLLIGVAVHAEQTGRTGDGADGTPADSARPGNTLFMYTIDASYESDGWNLFGSFVGSNNDPRASGASSTDNFGLVIQGGVFVADQWELFARWDTFWPDKDLASPRLRPRSYSAITAGVNYYMFQNSHAAKFTGQLVWNMNKTKNLLAAPGGVLPGFTSGGPVPDTRTGTLGDSKNGELAVMFGVQLLW